MLPFNYNSWNSNNSGNVNIACEYANIGKCMNIGHSKT